MRDTFSFLPWIEVDELRGNSIFATRANNHKYNVSISSSGGFSSPNDFEERLKLYSSKITSTYPLLKYGTGEPFVGDKVVYGIAFYNGNPATYEYELTDYPNRRFYREVLTFSNVNTNDTALLHSHFTSVTRAGPSGTRSLRTLSESERYIFGINDTATVSSDIPYLFINNSNVFPEHSEAEAVHYGWDFNSHPSTTTIEMYSGNLPPNTSFDTSAPALLYSFTPYSGTGKNDLQFYWNDETKRFDLPPLILGYGSNNNPQQICPLIPDAVYYAQGTTSWIILRYFDTARFADAPNKSTNAVLYINGTGDNDTMCFLKSSAQITGQTFRRWNQLAVTSTITENPHYFLNLRSLVLPNFELDNDGKFYILDGTTADVNIGNQEVICKQPFLYQIDRSLVTTERITYADNGHGMIICNPEMDDDIIVDDGANTDRNGFGGDNYGSVEFWSSYLYNGGNISGLTNITLPDNYNPDASYFVLRYRHNIGDTAPLNESMFVNSYGPYFHTITRQTLNHVIIESSENGTEDHTTTSDIDPILISSIKSNDVSRTTGVVNDPAFVDAKRTLIRDNDPTEEEFDPTYYNLELNGLTGTYAKNVVVVKSDNTLTGAGFFKISGTTGKWRYADSGFVPVNKAFARTVDQDAGGTTEVVNLFFQIYRMDRSVCDVYNGQMRFYNVSKTIDNAHYSTTTSLISPEYTGNQRLTFTWDNLPTVVMSPLQSIILTLEGVDVSREIMPINISNANSGASLNNSLPVIESYSSLAQTLRDLHDELVISRDQFDNTATSSINVTGDGLNERSLVFTAQFVTKDGFAYPVYIPPNGVFTLQLTFGVEFGLL